MKKILLVEDDPNIVSSLTLFMKNEGYLVDSANGQQTRCWNGCFELPG